MNKSARACGLIVAALIVFPVAGCKDSGGSTTSGAPPATASVSVSKAPASPPATGSTSASPSLSPSPAPSKASTSAAPHTAAPVPVTTTHTSPAPPRTSSPRPTSTHATAASCHPLTNGGNCYEPGEFCRKSDHGAHGIAGDGKAIVCEDNNGWRWEPV